MITKQQAETCTNFKQIAAYPKAYTSFTGGRAMQHYDTTKSIPLEKPLNWRANGKLKTWKRNPERFQLPIKHGLRTYTYLTNENAHLFEVSQ
ncbi:MAG: hypothetical protein WC107_07975 [Patescibacteria group bacterium]|jgi:hypothetical protein